MGAWTDIAEQHRASMKWRTLVPEEKFREYKQLYDRGEGFIATRAEKTKFVLCWQPAEVKRLGRAYFFPRPLYDY